MVLCTFILIIKQHLDLRILSYIKLYHVHCAMTVIHKMSRRLQNELLVFLWPLMAIAKLIDRCCHKLARYTNKDMVRCGFREKTGNNEKQQDKYI